MEAAALALPCFLVLIVDTSSTFDLDRMDNLGIAKSKKINY
jgi:hypothetical protein